MLHMCRHSGIQILVLVKWYWHGVSHYLYCCPYCSLALLSLMSVVMFACIQWLQKDSQVICAVFSFCRGWTFYVILFVTKSCCIMKEHVQGPKAAKRCQGSHQLETAELRCRSHRGLQNIPTRGVTGMTDERESLVAIYPGVTGVTNELESLVAIYPGVTGVTNELESLVEIYPGVTGMTNERELLVAIYPGVTGMTNELESLVAIYPGVTGY